MNFKINNALQQTKITASVIGFHFISGMMVGSFLGYSLDQYFDSYPLCISLGFFFGVASGFYNVWKDIKKIVCENQSE